MYLVEGHDNGVKVDGKAMKEKMYLELDATREVIIELPPSANNDDGDLVQTTEFLILQGKPINEPVAQHEIHNAFLDYQRTKFGGWPWPRDDMIFGQKKGRFALIDAKETRPPIAFMGSTGKEDGGRGEL